MKLKKRQFPTQRPKAPLPPLQIRANFAQNPGPPPPPKCQINS